MQEFLLYIETLKRIVSNIYEKETIFYDNGQWYSRYHGKNMTPEELTNWIIELTCPYDSDE